VGQKKAFGALKMKAVACGARHAFSIIIKYIRKK
jgi:hypothetical protein